MSKSKGKEESYYPLGRQERINLCSTSYLICRVSASKKEARYTDDLHSEWCIRFSLFNLSMPVATPRASIG
jgi:hypothetical protein